jgi:hypothetical protein
MKKGNQECWNNLELFFLTHLREMKPVDFAIFVWSFFKKQRGSQQLWDGINSKLQDKEFCGQLQSQDLFNIAWSLFNLQMKDQIVWKNLKERYIISLNELEGINSASLKFRSHICFLVQDQSLWKDERVHRYYRNYIERIEKIPVQDLEVQEKINVCEIMKFLIWNKETNDSLFEVLREKVNQPRCFVKKNDELLSYLELILPWSGCSLNLVEMA